MAPETNTRGVSEGTALLFFHPVLFRPLRAPPPLPRLCRPARFPFFLLLSLSSIAALAAFPGRSVRGPGRKPFLSPVSRTGCGDGGGVHACFLPGPPPARRRASGVGPHRAPKGPTLSRPSPRNHSQTPRRGRGANELPHTSDESRIESRTSHARVTQRVTLPRNALACMGHP